MKTCLLAALLFSAASVSSAETVDVLWTNARNSVATGNAIARSGGASGWTSGASSTLALASGDGYF